MGKIGWATKDPYGLGIRNAVWLANEDFKQRKRARKLLAVDRVASKAMDDMSDLYTDWDLCCAAIVLYRYYNMNAEEISKFLERIQEVVIEMGEKGVTGDTIRQVLEDEVGLEIVKE